ncbi:RNA 2',3'-cyclic phosphodiesterase [Methanosarcina hadiensis]|uniref:RNA 2',3'-cyclic phosphodiesterase n=1 Tax=Methanosarcina hadiensis TaxID=3078083 RepID=UPI00397734C2
MIRTFIAVELDPSFIEKIRQVQERFSGFDLKFVSPEIVHITLKFLGDIKESMVAPVSASLDSVMCEPFEAKIGGIGVFPKPSNPKVLWLGATGNFEALHNEVESVLKPFRFKSDERRFTAHATLARIKSLNKDQKSDFITILNELKNIELGSMQVNRLFLKKSTLTPDGPIYENLHTVYLD